MDILNIRGTYQSSSSQFNWIERFTIARPEASCIQNAFSIKTKILGPVGREFIPNTSKSWLDFLGFGAEKYFHTSSYGAVALGAAGTVGVLLLVSRLLIAACLPAT